MIKMIIKKIKQITMKQKLKIKSKKINKMTKTYYRKKPQ